MLLNDNSIWEPSENDIASWTELYQAVSVQQEVRAMTGWLEANPTRRKTSRGIKRFANSWLARAQDKGGSPMANRAVNNCGTTIVKSRDMTSLDDLTHDFCGSVDYQQAMLKKYGQYYSNGQRFTQ